MSHGFVGLFRSWRHMLPVWTAVNRAAANTKATATQAAPGAGLRNVCTGVTAVLSAGAAVPAAVAVGVRILSGSTEIWGVTLGLPGSAGATSGVVRNNCWIPGDEDEDMTIEFTAAGGASTYESVSIEGTTERI